MPVPPGYTGGQHDYQIRSLDIVPIEPSIREGEKLITSIYGSPATLPLTRYPPLNTVAPIITGPSTIPGTLTCQPGVWTGSPTPLLYFQWMKDGIDIAGATSNTYTTVPADDGTAISCEVRGSNGIGEDYIISSNSINVSLIEPIEIDQLELYMISGLTQNQDLVNTDQQVLYTSGMSVENRLDMNRAVTYFSTGIASENRQDVTCQHLHILTGLGDESSDRVTYHAAYVISEPFQGTLVDGVSQTLGLVNADAELGTEGWTTDQGVVTYSNVQKHEGGYSFYGGPPGSSYRSVYQDVDIAAVWESEVDLGTTYCEVTWQQRSDNFQDQANIRVEFFDGADVSLGTDNGLGLWASPDEIFFERTVDFAIPANTRKIRIFLEFQLQEGSTLNAYIDTIEANIRKGNRETMRTLYGPDFEYWRLRFTDAASNSGAALSELEFRTTIGGADQATGGTILFGSAGQGVINADYAFDDLRNTGYWAGADGSIAAGTSWLGYHLTSSVKLAEIDITAKQTGLNDMAQQFYVEGSNDGLTWIPVQRFDYEDIGDFVASEQKQFEILDGAFSYCHTTALVGNYTTDNVNNAGDYLQMGSVFQTKTRMNITHIAAYLDNQAFDYEIALVRLNNQKGTAAMISEVLEIISTTSSGVLGWETHALASTYEFEVDEYFAVIVNDLNTPANVDDANHCRVHIVDNHNGEPLFQSHLTGAVFSHHWRNVSGDIFVGRTNFSDMSNQTITLVDFQGSIF